MTDELFDVEERPAASATPASPDAQADGASAGASDGDTIVIRLRVQPGPGRSAVAGRFGDALHVRVAPPPADDRANDAVLALLADLLDVPTSQLELASGERSREKKVRVRGVDPAAVRLALGQAVDGAASVGGAPRGRGGRTGR